MPTDDSPLADGLLRAVEQLGEAFDARAVRYALIGGLAATMRGRPRFTKDVDILLDVPQLTLPGLLADLADRGFTLDAGTVIREYVREHVTAFQFGSVRIDWLKPILPLYTQALTSATPLNWTEGHPIRVASAEGLILTKMVAFRPQDQLDIEALLAANRDAIDMELIRTAWAPFAATEPDRTAWLAAAVARNVPNRA